MTRIPVNGIELNVRRQGSGPALLLLHGFTGSGATWQPFDWPGYETVAVDLPGHGESDKPASAERYRMERCVEDLVTLLDELGVERAAVLGYSMGGRVALHLALHAPERLWALVIESASPGIENEAERADRRRSDGELADSIVRDGIAPFVDRWQAIPLFASQSRLPADARERLVAVQVDVPPPEVQQLVTPQAGGQRQPEEREPPRPGAALLSHRAALDHGLHRGDVDGIGRCYVGALARHCARGSMRRLWRRRGYTNAFVAAGSVRAAGFDRGGSAPTEVRGSPGSVARSWAPRRLPRRTNRIVTTMTSHRILVKTSIMLAVLLAAPPPAPAQPGPTRVLTARVEQRELPSTVTLVGKVQPLRRSTVGSEVEGIVPPMPVRQ
ncbi:MAG: alpha/beta fold hydrolase, partial [Chloroflexi bacterium]|nr:alpha/beta fold hydrolase [Chloroflexota bacterium]